MLPGYPGLRWHRSGRSSRGSVCLAECVPRFTSVAQAARAATCRRGHARRWTSKFISSVCKIEPATNMDDRALARPTAPRPKTCRRRNRVSYGASILLLDERGLLSLVLDLLSADEALCVALVCRSFRDKVFDRHATAVSPRLRTSVSAVVGSIARLAWARQLGRCGRCCQTAADSTCRIAATSQDPSLLSWAVENGCKWILEACARAAAVAGSVGALEWIINWVAVRAG